MSRACPFTASLLGARPKLSHSVPPPPRAQPPTSSPIPDDERDAALYYLLARHPGRALVFVNAVSSLRRVAAVLKLLGLPSTALHAQQQQRQRLKVGLVQGGGVRWGAGPRGVLSPSSCCACLSAVDSHGS